MIAPELVAAQQGEGGIWLRRGLRAVGWASIAAGALILLYLVYSLVFTNFAMSSAQAQLLEDWNVDVGPLPAAGTATGNEVRPVAPARPDGAVASAGAVSPAGGDGPAGSIDAGGAVAVLEFSRPGSRVVPVHAGPLFVTDGVSDARLQQGPGHYPGSALPGETGNFAVAGHRTTYGAPFFHLDQLRAGDLVHVTDRSNRRHTYRVVQQQIVGPHDAWVLGPDPLGRGRSLLTLTTCHPRFSAAQRLVTFAELES